MLILKTLSLEPMHGFGIARRIEQISRGVFKVNPGSLLTALQRLERAGWLDAEWRQTENSRRARSSTRSRAPAGSSSRSRPRTGRAAPPRSRGCSRRRASRMSLWRQLTRGLRVLTNRAAADRDVADEVAALSRQATAAHSGARPVAGRGAPRRAARARQHAPSSANRSARYGWENVVGAVARRPALRRAAAARPIPASPRSA